MIPVGEFTVEIPTPGARERQAAGVAKLLRTFVVEAGTAVGSTGIDIADFIRSGEFPETRELLGNFDANFDGVLTGEELFSDEWIDRTSDTFLGGFGTRVWKRRAANSVSAPPVRISATGPYWSATLPPTTGART